MGAWISMASHLSLSFVWLAPEGGRPSDRKKERRLKKRGEGWDMSQRCVWGCVWCPIGESKGLTYSLSAGAQALTHSPYNLWHGHFSLRPQEEEAKRLVFLWLCVWVSSAENLTATHTSPRKKKSILKNSLGWPKGLISHTTGLPCKLCAFCNISPFLRAWLPSAPPVKWISIIYLYIATTFCCCSFLLPSSPSHPPFERIIQHPSSVFLVHPFFLGEWDEEEARKRDARLTHKNII